MKDSGSGKQSKETNYEQYSKDELINKAFAFHSKGNIPKAIKFYQMFLNQGFSDARVYSNLGQILRDQGNLKEAELLTLQAIKLDLNYADAYSNLSIILRDLGRLQEAESSIRKAIEINPNIANSHFSLGIILRDLGRLQEAESSIRKAIEINPNIANSHFSLGIILRDLGRLQEAELYSRKAIEINPESATAHLNLGIILRDLGRLQEAELYSRKAIEINPESATAHSNLGIILRDLGKLKELIDLSKSTLKSKSINQEYKLIASIRMTIAHLLQKNYLETLLSIKKTNDFINQGVIDKIKNKNNKQFSFHYSRFLTSLYQLLNKENNYPNSSRIPHFGESHCLSFAHQNLSISSQIKKIQPVLITGGKAWHFANHKNNQWKDSLTQQIKNHKYSDEVFISFGEIDCRKDEGILTYARKKNKNISEVCEKTVMGYLNYMEKVLAPCYSKKYYFGVPAPVREKQYLDDLDKKRVEVIKLYNSILKKEVLSRGSFFLDVFAMTSTKNGENNNFHMCDEFHLSPKCLYILFKNYLIKS